MVLRSVVGLLSVSELRGGFAMVKKFQVFISGTFDDLMDERQAAVEAILAAEHIPAGMEWFVAPNVDTFREVIIPWIDKSDIFLLLVGGRYGMLHPEEKKSYTHLEWEHAVNSTFANFVKMRRLET